jgi:uncharacterized membrane protein YeaQ/YmgE (transglycosylase-associated protein family)
MDIHDSLTYATLMFALVVGVISGIAGGFLVHSMGIRGRWAMLCGLLCAGTGALLVIYLFTA